MLRRATVVIGLGSALALGACYASTEPATDVRFDSATLNARGTADSGPAHSYFEIWQQGFPSRRRTVGGTDWPAGASGPFSARVASLYANTTYEYRVCGADVGKVGGCAQTRSFTTTAATRDAVKGMWFQFSEDFAPFGRIDAEAGATSADPPSGSLEYKPLGLNARFTGFVTCLVVDGERAAVGAVGQYRDTAAGTTRPATAVAAIIENEPESADLISVTVSFEAGRPGCTGVTWPTDVDSVNSNDLIVYDAP